LLSSAKNASMQMPRNDTTLEYTESIGVSVLLLIFARNLHGTENPVECYRRFQHKKLILN
jgi:hypothetical protein